MESNKNNLKLYMLHPFRLQRTRSTSLQNQTIQFTTRITQDIIKVGLSPSKKILCYLLDWKPLRSYEKCFLFHLKSSFCSQDILVFVTTFWWCRKNGFIKNISLTSKFMTSQPGLQTIPIHILPNISQSKDNQRKKFGQLTEYNKRNIFLQKLRGKWGRESSSRPLFIF